MKNNWILGRKEDPVSNLYEHLREVIWSNYTPQNPPPPGIKSLRGALFLSIYGLEALTISGFHDHEE